MNTAAVPHTITNVEGHRAVWITGPACIAFNAVGEAHFAAAMGAIAQQLQGRLDVSIVGWLSAVPKTETVSITVFGRLVGLLPPEIELCWLPLIAQFEAQYGAKVACNITLDPPSKENSWGYGLKVWLPQVAPIVDKAAQALSLAATKLQQEVDRLREERAAEEAKKKAVAAELASIRAQIQSSQQEAAAAARTAKAAATQAAMVARVEAAQVAKDASEQLASIRAQIHSAQREAAAAAQAAATQAAMAAQAEVAQVAKGASEQLASIRAQIQAAQMDLDVLDDVREVKAFGYYAPKYDFESSSQYAFRLAEIREQQKSMMSTDKAYVAGAKLTIGGSAAEGRKLIKQQGRLMLRAFNGESDAAISRVKFGNLDNVVDKVKKAFESINKLGELQSVAISPEFLNLRLAELYLVHEHREKERDEREEQKRVKELMREEMKAQEEIDRAKAEAEKEEEKATAALAKAKFEMDVVEAAGKNNEKLASLVAKLESELSSAIDRKAKAIARAQLTKSGHVYVLSNLGSFGEGVYKIGMTRRLEPLERVEELGDASVPYPFDVHAIIYCEDAPGLENKLHRAFAARRVNLVNARKEYFRVSLDEIRAAVEKEHGLVSFLLAAHAEEYRKSEAMRSLPGSAEHLEGAVGGS